MVVGKDDCRGIEKKRLFKYYTRVHYSSIGTALGNQFGTQESETTINIKGNEFLR